MKQKILRGITWFQRFGLKRHDTKIEKITSSLGNLLLTPLVIIHISFLVHEIVSGNTTRIILNLIALGITLIMLILNFFKKYQASVTYLNLVYPLIAGGIPLVILTFNRLDYIFFIFILTGIIYSRRFIFRIFFTLYNVAIYISTNYWLQTYSQETYVENGFLEAIIFFLITAFSIFLIVNYFYSEIIKNEKDNQTLVKNLTENNAKLSLLNQELERFNHIASHDLKTPLRSIMSFSSLIQKDLKKEAYENVDEYFQFIRNSALQMNNLITDTLEYSQIEQVTITRENLDLNKIITDLSRQIKTSHSENIEITHAQLPSYYGQKSLLIRLFQNIFENGIKYNKSAKKVIDINFKIDDASLILEIKDNGIGIEQKYLDKIFVLFERLHSSTEFTGTGLGLSICKKIVEQLSGSIWADSAIGKGSTFYVSLPIIKAV